MAAKVKGTCDVFLSHSALDSRIAREIAASLKAAGLETFRADAMEPVRDSSQAIWEALAESRALIVIVSADAPIPPMGMVEIGAAAAWNKPIFLVVNGPPSTKLPPGLSSYPAYPLAHLEEVIRAIRSSFEPLTEEQRAVLLRVYQKMETSADQLGQSPKALRELTRQVNKFTHKQFSGERLLSEILRMRKKGQLPRLRAVQRRSRRPA